VFEALATLIKDFWLGQSPFKFWKFHSHMPKDGKEKGRNNGREGKESRDRLNLSKFLDRAWPEVKEPSHNRKRRTSLENGTKFDGGYYFASGNLKCDQNSKFMSGLMQKFHFANICGTVPPKELLKKCCLDIYQTGKKSV